ncbi:MAG TPA: thiamine pyrophosphate-binding protein [Methylomirabilota bacterium]|jgi:benzoylformate decarboxylase|nr:thiamine pyrophosphate-binding protein [Methylomirabilota bacterium]
MNVAAVLMEILKSTGVRYLFGNPGTTELPFLDALPDSSLEYVLGLQEATAVAAADGYAQATGQVGVVNVHVAPGLANSLSILHNAARSKSPVVVTAGQQDTRFLMHEPILAADLARMAEQFTKWSHEVRRPEDAPVALRRALKVALTPPTGPVFLSMPMDLMGPAVDDTGAAPPPVAAKSRPEPGAILHAAELLASAANPIIIAGDGVARAGAMAELTALAELLGARVHGEPVYRRTSFPGNHALWRGGLFPSPAGVRRALEECDALLIVGANVFTWFLHTEGTPFPRGLRVVQIDDDPWEIGRSYPVTLGIAADPKAALAELTGALRNKLTEKDRAAAAARVEKIGAARGEMVKRVSAAARSEAERVPIGQAHLMHTLASLLPADAIVVDESATSLPFVLRYMPFATPGSFFGGKTGTLGWGMGAAIGVQLGSPGRKVVATIGDGSVMYAPQALWTAAHYRLPITYVVPNNSSYAILKSGMLSLDLASAKRGIYPGMDLVSPEIDYAGLARSLGVRAERVEKPGELRDVLAACLAGPGPSLVDVAIDRGFKPML